MAANVKSKRDNRYYLDRLRFEHPRVYADLQAGKFKNASEAFIAAGLRKRASGFDALMSAWEKASPLDRDAFKLVIGCSTPAPVAPVSPKSVTSAVVRPAVPATSEPSVLSPQLKQDIRDIMDRRRLKSGDVIHELGLNRLNASLGRALHRASQLQESLIIALEGWVKRHGAN